MGGKRERREWSGFGLVKRGLTLRFIYIKIGPGTKLGPKVVDWIGFGYKGFGILGLLIIFGSGLYFSP